MQRLLLALLAACSLAACKGEAAPPKSVRPALWKVQDADTTIYLFGTIHLLPKGLDWETPEIRRALASSHALYLETVLDRDRSKLAAVIAKLALKPGLPPVAERVPPEQRAKLAAMIAKAGVPAAALDRYDTWAVALTLTAATLKDLPVAAEAGAEEVLRGAFEASRRSVLGLETPEQQLGYFARLPEAAQREFLVSVLAEDDARQQFDRMLAAWSAGDVRAIATSFDDELKTSPMLADALIGQRNRAWADKLAVRMGPPGVVFVAVGAGHLAGPQSVEALLKARGFRVTRIE